MLKCSPAILESAHFLESEPKMRELETNVAIPISVTPTKPIA